MADDREPCGRLAFEGHVSGLAGQESPPWQDRPPAWEELSDGDREFYMRIGGAVAAAERERIARLAEACDAFYDAPCPDGVPGCVHQDTPFARLIRQPQECDDEKGPGGA